MEKENVITTLEARYSIPYTKERKCREMFREALGHALEDFEDKGTDMEYVCTCLQKVLHEIVCANRDIISFNRFPADRNWDSKFNLLSPALDLTAPDETFDEEYQWHQEEIIRTAYMMINGLYNEDNKNVDRVKAFLLFYDVWLQACVGWDNPATILENLDKHLKEKNKTCGTRRLD